MQVICDIELYIRKASKDPSRLFVIDVDAQDRAAAQRLLASTSGPLQTLRMEEVYDVAAMIQERDRNVPNLTLTQSQIYRRIMDVTAPGRASQQQYCFFLDAPGELVSWNIRCRLQVEDNEVDNMHDTCF